MLRRFNLRTEFTEEELELIARGEYPPKPEEPEPAIELPAPEPVLETAVASSEPPAGYISSWELASMMPNTEVRPVGSWDLLRIEARDYQGNVLGHTDTVVNLQDIQNVVITCERSGQVDYLAVRLAGHEDMVRVTLDSRPHLLVGDTLRLTSLRIDVQSDLFDVTALGDSFRSYLSVPRVSADGSARSESPLHRYFRR